jgi:protein disulfide-isomerase
MRSTLSGLLPWASLASGSLALVEATHDRRPFGLPHRDRVIPFLLLGMTFLLAGCGGREGPAQPAEAAHAPEISSPAGIREIAWFKGSVEEAIAAASRDKKFLLIYWGAKWCPYCQALRKTVFTRRDFVEKTALFVPVYLDGDLPGAQAWGETFKVSGYPTLLILKPDRTEIARMSGGMDLSLYASLLDEALQDQRPILDVLKNVSGPQDCHRLAYYGWDPTALSDINPGAEQGIAPATLATLLSAAAAHCQGPALARLQVSALAFALQGKPDQSGPIEREEFMARLQDLNGLLEHPELSLPAIDLIAGLDDSVFTVVAEQSRDFIDQFRIHWVARMQAAAEDSRFGDSDRLIALASALDATKALTPDHRIPHSMQDLARDRIRQALDADRDRFKRNDLVNAAGIVYDVLGDDAAAHDLYVKELPNTRTPYYYMSHLAAIAEREGRSKEALDWMARAYASSEGPATRLRWGNFYVQALLRLAPEDTARIRSAALQVAADIAQSDAGHGRSRTALSQINKAMERWANTPGRRAVAAEFAAHLPQGAAVKST